VIRWGGWPEHDPIGLHNEQVAGLTLWLDGDLVGLPRTESVATGNDGQVAVGLNAHGRFDGRRNILVGNPNESLVVHALCRFVWNRSLIHQTDHGTGS